MNVSYNSIQADGLGSFSKKLGRISAKAGKKLATNVFKKPKIQAELWRLLQTLLPQLQLKTQKQLSHLYLKYSIFSVKVKVFTWAILYILCYRNGAKNR